MLVRELMAVLAACPPDAKVVLDVDREVCHSDRNVLDVQGARMDDVGGVGDIPENTAWCFIDAGAHV